MTASALPPAAIRAKVEIERAVSDSPSESETGCGTDGKGMASAVAEKLQMRPPPCTNACPTVEERPFQGRVRNVESAWALQFAEKLAFRIRVSL